MGVSCRQTASWRVKDSNVLGGELLLQGWFVVRARRQVRDPAAQQPALLKPGASVVEQGPLRRDGLSSCPVSPQPPRQRLMCRQVFPGGRVKSVHRTSSVSPSCIFFS